jgi:uncharacterized membrane protein
MTRASLLRAGTGLLFLLYPFLIYLGLHEFQPRVIACLLLIAAILRLISNRYGEKKEGEMGMSLYWIAAAVLVIIFTFVTDLKLGLYLYPPLVNLIFFTFFLISLFYPPTVIEKIARRHRSEMPVKAVVYTRKVTQAWCLFFLINGSMSVMSIFYSEEWWVLYNGFIAYILIGLMLAGEYFIRIKVIGNVND